jgi:hypothetical protein
VCDNGGLGRRTFLCRQPTNTAPSRYFLIARIRAAILPIPRLLFRQLAIPQPGHAIAVFTELLRVLGKQIKQASPGVRVYVRQRTVFELEMPQHFHHHEVIQHIGKIASVVGMTVT